MRSRELNAGTVSFYCNVIRAYASPIYIYIRYEKSMHLRVYLLARRVSRTVLFCADITAIKAFASLSFFSVDTN